jgi:serine/threonine-protein kinase RsbW
MSSSLTIPSATRHLARVRRFVAQHAAEAGLGTQAIDALRLAVDEACTNAIRHAYAGREDGKVTVETTQEANRFTVVIRHTGLPFNAENYHPISLAEALRRRRRGGFGVMLIDRLVDHVEYRQRGNVSEVRLVKQLDPSAA